MKGEGGRERRRARFTEKSCYSNERGGRPKRDGRKLDRPSKPFPFASRGEIRNNNGRMFFIVFTEYTSTALSNNG